jgi:hypothetical protein
LRKDALAKLIALRVHVTKYCTAIVRKASAILVPPVVAGFLPAAILETIAARQPHFSSLVWNAPAPAPLFSSRDSTGMGGPSRSAPGSRPPLFSLKDLLKQSRAV